MITRREPSKASLVRGVRSDDGAALLAVLVVLTLFLVLCTTVAALAFEQHWYLQRDLDRVQARYSAESAVYVAMLQLEEDPSWRPFNEAVRIGGGFDAVVTVRQFGGYYQVEATAHVRAHRETTHAILGVNHALSDRALVLGDVGTALHIAGTTQVVGPLLVGTRGAQRGTLRGRSFRGRIEGRVEVTEEAPLPSFDRSHIDSELNLLDMALVARAEVNADSVIYLAGGTVLTGGDSKPETSPVTMLAAGNLVLSDGFQVSRGSRIVARGQIHITSDVGPELGIVFSQQSVYVDGGRFSGQLFARDSIHVGPGSYLRYPSLVYVSGRAIGTEHHAIAVIGDGATLDGTVAYPGSASAEQQDRGRITIESGGLVRGAVLSGGQAEVRGTVYGSVLAYQLRHYDSPQTLINWLVDAAIDLPLRPASFLLPVGLRGEHRLDVMYWDDPARAEMQNTLEDKFQK